MYLVTEADVETLARNAILNGELAGSFLHPKKYAISLAPTILNADPDAVRSQFMAPTVAIDLETNSTGTPVP